MKSPENRDAVIKAKILRTLHGKAEPVAEDLICRNLQISTEAVRDHLRDLEKLGYLLKTDQELLQLRHEPDTPFPWKFPGRESCIHYFRELTSTMDTARELAAGGCPDFTIVIAESQQRGRGRLQRTWHSDSGGLYFTIVLRPDLPPEKAFSVNFAASLSLARILQEQYHVDAKVKWPNDILIDGRKVSGMLSEMGVESGRLTYVNIGIGINVNNDPVPKEPNAVSLQTMLGSMVDRSRLLSSFLDELQQTLLPLAPEEIISRWKQYTMTIGRRVTIMTTKDSYEGMALDVAADGALILEKDDGTRIEVIYGDCFHC